MAQSTRRQLPKWVTSIAVGAGLLASFPSDGTGQGIACDADQIAALPVPEIRTSAAKAALRVAPEPDGKVVVTLPPNIGVPLLDQVDGWFVVNYRDRDKYRRLYVSTQDAEGPSAASLGADQLQAQEWTAAHTRICERIGREEFARNSLFVGTAIAGLTSVIWHLYVDDDEHYGTAFAVWSGISVAALVGTVYKSFGLYRAHRELENFGGFPSFADGGFLPSTGGARADLLFDAATRRLAVVASWRP